MWQWNSQIPISVSHSVRFEFFVLPTWVIGSESDDSITLVLNHERVSSDRRGWQVRVCSAERTSFGERSFEDLELMAMEMHRVLCGQSMSD